MLADIVAPERLRAGHPQALAALCAVAGWPVVRYCQLAGAGPQVARAAVVAFARFRRRVLTAGAAPAVDHDRLLLDCAREAVEELRGEEADAAARREAEKGFALASPRPLSPRLATAVLRALVEAAPLSGSDRPSVRERAERSYADAYAAAAPAPPVAGEARLPDASALLTRAAASALPAVAPSARAAQPTPPAARQRRGGRAHAAAPAPPCAAPLRSAAGRRSGAIALVAVAIGAVVALTLVLALGTGGDGERAATPAPEPQVVAGRPGLPLTASGARFEVVPIGAAPWARGVRSRPLPAGRRWVTVAVRVRNLARATLPLRGLGYRLRTAAGIVVGPLTLDVPAALERTGGRLGVGGRASVHLGFAPPRRAGTLTLAFEPGGMRQPTVLVRLGARS